MSKITDIQGSLFKNNLCQDKIKQLVIKDTKRKKKYSLRKMKNKVVLGNTFEVLKKMDSQIIDMIFIIDSPYFLQLPKKK